MKLTRRTLLKSSVVLAGCGTAMGNPPGRPVDTSGPPGPSAPGTTPTSDQPPSTTDQPKPQVPTKKLPPIDVVESSVSFPLAVMSGDMTATSALVWTQYASTNRLQLFVWPEGGEPVSADATPDDHGFVHFDVSELSAATHYRFTFVELVGDEPSARSTLGHFKTAPAPDSQEVVTFGAACCTHQRRLPFPVMARAATVPLDFFIHGGDHCYTDGAGSEQDFLDLYHETWASSGLRALHSAHGLYATWDDHEFKDNFDPETIAPDLRTWATDTFFRHHPIRRHATVPNQLWRSFSFGRTLELFVLDSRSERKPSSRNAADAQYLSRAQMDWLKNGLKNSPARYKFIVNSVPIGEYGGLFALAAKDRWEGYPAARNELLNHIADENIGGVLFISGDFHLGAVSKLSEAGKFANMREVLVGPGGNWANAFWSTLQDSPTLDFITPEANFVVFSVDPTKAEVKVSFVDEDGAVLFSKVYDDF